MSRHSTLYFECDGCAITVGHVDNVDTGTIGADETDTMMPPDWTQVIVRRVLRDPDYEAPATAESVLADMLEGIDPAQRGGAEGILGAQAQMLAAAAADQAGTTHFVDELELHYCIICTVRSLGQAAIDAFVDAGWMEAPKIKAVPPSAPPADPAAAT